MDVITDATGNVVERLSFDAFGQRRVSDTWGDGVIALVTNNARGFTGHEHLDTTGLIHMNGRVYDPLLGRFLSADPFVKQPEDLQSLNRYSYVKNNPLSYTDPSGFIFESIGKIFEGIFKGIGKVFKGIGKAVGSVYNKVASNPYLSIAVTGELVLALDKSPLGCRKEI